MSFKDGPLAGVKIFDPRVFEDERGYFFESYHETRFKEAGIVNHFVQDNESKSAKGTVRALHYQVEPFAQAKLIRVIHGSVYDVMVDLREDSKTYGQHFGILVSAENKTQVLIPRGFAHGFVALEDDTVFAYKCDNFYSKEHEGGIIYNDPKINIDWQLPTEILKVSAKDAILPTFGNHKPFSSYS